jgi:hypothetical protein
LTNRDVHVFERGEIPFTPQEAIAFITKVEESSTFNEFALVRGVRAATLEVSIARFSTRTSPSATVVIATISRIAIALAVVVLRTVLVVLVSWSISAHVFGVIHRR